MPYKNAAHYVEEARRTNRITAPEAPWGLLSYEVFSGTSELEVFERVLVLLDQAGIPYECYNFMISVGIGSMNCTMDIYRNTGKHQKTRSKHSRATAPILPDANTYIVALWDTTRFFSRMLTYIIEDYSAETIGSFTHEDLNFGCYCPEPELGGAEYAAADEFHRECSSISRL